MRKIACAMVPFLCATAFAANQQPFFAPYLECQHNLQNLTSLHAQGEGPLRNPISNFFPNDHTGAIAGDFDGMRGFYFYQAGSASFIPLPAHLKKDAKVRFRNSGKEYCLTIASDRSFLGAPGSIVGHCDTSQKNTIQMRAQTQDVSATSDAQQAFAQVLAQKMTGIYSEYKSAEGILGDPESERKSRLEALNSCLDVDNPTVRDRARSEKSNFGVIADFENVLGELKDKLTAKGSGDTASLSDRRSTKEIEAEEQYSSRTSTTSGISAR